MSESRCPACAAAVRPGDEWCTLCFADLRPPAPEPEPTAAAPEQHLVQDLVYDPLDESLFATTAAHPVEPSSYSSQLLFPPRPTQAPVLDPSDPLGLDAPAVPAQPTKPLSGPFLPQWTCEQCGGVQTYDELTCHVCGKALLGDEAAAVPALVKKGSGASKATVIFGGMAAVTLGLLVIATVLGMLF